jgi:hypothetical protein
MMHKACTSRFWITHATFRNWVITVVLYKWLKMVAQWYLDKLRDIYVNRLESISGWSHRYIPLFVKTYYTSEIWHYDRRGTFVSVKEVHKILPWWMVSPFLFITGMAHFFMVICLRVEIRHVDPRQRRRSGTVDSWTTINLVSL